MSWKLAVLSGWLSIVLLAAAWYARRRLRASLKAPLTDRAEDITHLWEQRDTLLHKAGLGLSWLSILCFAFLLLSRLIM